MNLSQVLENYGLGAKESQVYLATLSLGTCPVQKISKLANLPRSTCYEILDALKRKGLVSTFQKKQVRYFSAEDPHTLISLAQDKAHMVEQVLPEFMALYATTKSRPAVRFYEGKEVAKLVFREIASEAQENIGYSSADDILEYMGEELTAFIKVRKKKKIASKIIMSDTPKARAMQARDIQELREIRLTPPVYRHNTLILIWGTKVAILLLKEQLSAFIIESQELAQFHKTMFELVWQTLPPSPGIRNTNSSQPKKP